MYAYDQYDQAMVDARVAEFRDQCERRLAGKLSEDQFKPLRLMNGLYLQLHAYMLRVAIPYGVMSATQLRALAGIARRYDRGYAHFTTRQNLLRPDLPDQALSGPLRPVPFLLFGIPLRKCHPLHAFHGN